MINQTLTLKGDLKMKECPLKNCNNEIYGNLICWECKDKAEKEYYKINIE